MAKSKRKIREIIVPLVVVGLLGVAAFLLTPGVNEEPSDALAEVKINPDSLAAGRQYGVFKLDSIQVLFTDIDPKSLNVEVSEKDDSLSVRRRAKYPPSRFLRIYQNQRTSEDFRKLKNCPIRMLPGKENGYLAPITEEKGTRFVTLPYDVMAGLLEESGRLTAGKSEDKK